MMSNTFISPVYYQVILYTKESIEFMINKLYNDEAILSVVKDKSDITNCIIYNILYKYHKNRDLGGLVLALLLPNETENLLKEKEYSKLCEEFDNGNYNDIIEKTISLKIDNPIYQILKTKEINYDFGDNELSLPLLLKATESSLFYDYIGVLNRFAVAIAYSDATVEASEYNKIQEFEDIIYYDDITQSHNYKKILLDIKST